MQPSLFTLPTLNFVWCSVVAFLAS